MSIETKDGRSKPGTSIAVYGGSIGGRAVEFEHGGSKSDGINWYVAGNLLHDDGWRIKSPSDVRQMFSNLGWQGVKTTSFASAAGVKQLPANRLAPTAQCKVTTV